MRAFFFLRTGFRAAKWRAAPPPPSVPPGIGFSLSRQQVAAPRLTLRVPRRGRAARVCGALSHKLRMKSNPAFGLGCRRP
ncbi:hypothetical protein CBM2587_A10082 [Cupriavidus taiwanensis]|uniref:Uncharacterized protein n=1 Tax=Cupriavidus taiwanensis TaxID=164546 RepID=A0A375BB71_9BURK|nr:hypothetical protein CBM2587_A10082 [Cupriavidus taiwanensis]